MSLAKIFWCLCIFLWMSSEGIAQNKPVTSELLEAEVSQFRRTGPYAEVEATCHRFASTYPETVRCVSIGRTAEGRSIMALVVSHSGALTPDQAQRMKVPVVLAIGGTHAGEMDGKDAGLMVVRDLLKKSLF